MSKWLLLLILIFSAQANAQLPEPKLLESQGEFLVKQVRERLREELDALYGQSQSEFSNNEMVLQMELQRILLYPFPMLFAPGTDPDFALSPGEPPRTAVTNKNPGGPIKFNLSVINQPDQFAFEDAVRLFVHELGHKAPPDYKAPFGENYQKAVDQLAAKIASLATARDFTETLAGGTLYSHASFGTRRDYNDYPEGRFDEKVWPLLLWRKGEKVFDLSAIVFEKYLRVNHDKRDNDLYTGLVVHELNVTDVKAGQLLRLQLSHQKNKKDLVTRFQNRYLEELTFLVTERNGVAHFEPWDEDKIPTYPTEQGFLKIKAKQDIDLLIKGVLELDLAFQLIEIRHWEPEHAEGVFLVDGKRIVVPLVATLDRYREIPFQVKARLPDSVKSAGDVFFTGVRVRYLKTPKERGPPDLNMMNDWFFVPAAEKLKVWLKYDPPCLDQRCRGRR